MWDGIVHRNQKCFPVTVSLLKKCICFPAKHLGVMICTAFRAGLCDPLICGTVRAQGCGWFMPQVGCKEPENVYIHIMHDSCHCGWLKTREKYQLLLNK